MNEPPHGLPRELKMSGQDSEGMIFLNDYVVPVSVSYDDNGKLQIKPGDCDPEAERQLNDWLTWSKTASSETP